MPDWSYRTVLRPWLFGLGPDRARGVAIGALSALARMPGGLWLIDFMGHMRADPRLAVVVGAVSAGGPVGLGALIDPGGVAAAAFARFGVGFVEVGPVAADVTGVVPAPDWRLDRDAWSIGAAAEAATAADDIAAQLASPAPSAPIWVRLAVQSPADCARAVERLRDLAALFLVDAADDASESTAARIRAAVAAAVRGGSARPVLLSLRADRADAAAVSAAALEAGAAGVFVRGETRTDAGLRIYGRPVHSAVLAQVGALRAALPKTAVLVAGGVVEPDDVRRFHDAGAQLTATDAGLVHSGPGLVKRCNEALLLAAEPPAALEPVSLDAARRAWFWTLMLGVAMLLGGALTFAIASTRVVLPYDETLCGMKRAQFVSLNPRLLPFMAHDRVNLAGSMLSLGVLYGALAWNGVRRGQHWAQVTVAVSALSGFLSFFLFLGFGYFDPFHAFVTAVLFQFLLLCLITQASAPAPLARAEWHETAAWRRAQWGQLLFIATGIGLFGAGLMITVIGCTDVFVRTDLEFLRATAATLLIANDRLVPLVAHDRASLGGMLIANGLAVWLTAQWGLRAGARWLWRALAWGGNVAFACAIGVHFAVGYLSAFHLAPAFAGWVLWWSALLLTREWMAGSGS